MRFELPGVSSKKLLISYAAGAILLWLFFRNTDWVSIYAGVQNVAWPLLGLAVALRFAALFLSALRWRYLLLPVQSVRIGSLMGAIMIGMTASLAISGQASELVRPIILSRNESLDFTAALSTIAAEWLLDALAILSLFIPALYFLRSGSIARIGGSDAFSNLTFSLLVLAFIAALAGLLLIRRRPLDFTFRNFPLPERFREILVNQLRRFDRGLESLRRPHGFSSLYGYSLAVSLLTAMSCWLALASFGLSLPIVSSLIVLGIVTVGGLIPTPGAVGGFHAVCQFSLMTLFRVESSRTVLPVVGLHAVLYIPAAVIGALCTFPYWRRSAEPEILS